MEEGNSAGAFTSPGSLSQAQNLFEEEKAFEKPKPPARRVQKKKAVLRQLRKKLNEAKPGQPGVASNGVDDGGLHDWPGLVSSTSATESATEEYKKKLLSVKKNGKRGINFAKFEDALRTTPFVFQKKLSRIDWRRLHTIDVDKIVREVDLDTLEAVVDTIASSDIQGEDTRNFTEANFVKIFRLAQLMVEYLLHVQELLATQKSQLLADGTTIQRRMEKHKERFAKLLTGLTQCRHDLKQAKKTLRIYEAMLKVQGENQQQQQLQQKQQSVTQQMVRCCPLCDKLFESSYYLDLHIARRHPKSNEMAEEKILAVVSKAEEATAARVKAETTAALQNEIQHLRSMSQAELQRTEAAAQFQIASLQASLRESNSKVQEVQNKVEQLLTQVHNSSVSARKEVAPVGKEVKDKETEEKLKELGDQLKRVQNELKDLTKEKSNLMKELDSTKSDILPLGTSTAAKQKDDRKNTQSGDYHQEKRPRNKGKHIEDLDALSSTTSDSEDRLMDHGNSSNISSNEATDGKDKIPGKHQKSRLSPPLKVGKEDMRRSHASSKDHSAPERKRKQRLHDDQSSTPQRSIVPTEYSDSATPTPREPENTDYEKYRCADREPRSERATISEPWKLRKQSPASRQVPDKHTPRLSASLRSADKEILGVAKADLELDLARAEEKRLGLQEVGKVAAIKKTKRVTGSAPGGQRTTNEKETLTREKKRLEAEKEMEMERLAKETAEEETTRRLEIAAAASMDVGEDGPIIPVAEKEKWLQEHPYKPIPQRPHILSKYPHPPSVFEDKRDDLLNRLGEQLGGELKKFGFSSDTEGISDSIYQAATAALEKQNKHRASALQTNQKKSLEYERGAIVWHTQRAVRERDIQIIESHFEEESDEASSTSRVSGGEDSSFTDDEDDEHSTQEKETRKTRNPVTPQIKDQDYYTSEKSRQEADLSGESQPGVFQSNWSADKKHVNYSANSYSRKQMNRFKMQAQSPSAGGFSFNEFKENSGGHTKYSPHWAESKKDAEEKRFEDNQAEAEFGLGQWESDEEMSTHVRRKVAKEQKDEGTLKRENLSDRGSDESVIFRELDAEIDEIIRL